MPKRSSFWGSFWRETGKNTGKWTSNKIFGSGWSTPYKHIIENNDYNDPVTSDESYTMSHSGEEERVRRDPKYLYEKASSIDFSNPTVEDITEKLDELLLGAHQAIQDQSSISIFTAKIRSGIQRLRRTGEMESALFYEKELNRIHRSYYLKKAGLFILAIIVFGGLFFMAFFVR